MFKKLQEAIEVFTPAMVPTALSAFGFTQEEYTKVRDLVIVARKTPPRIALIGETGVGKTTTINALFNQNEPVSHSRACTQHEKELTVEHGTLRVVDMPGLGEDIERDREHVALYMSELPTCDVILWVLKADNRAIASVQRNLGDLIDSKALDPRRLVIALNQVDMLQPGDWHPTYNIPSPEQEKTLAERIDDIQSRLGKVVKVDELKLVPYSALRNYRLADLLSAMKDAADRRVQWVLGDLASYRSFDEGISVGED